MKHRIPFLMVVAWVWVGLVSTPALAQSDYPNKPIRIIVPWPVGGVADIQAVHVPNKGSPQAMIDQIAGPVGFHFVNSASALPHINGQKVQALLSPPAIV